MNTWRYARKVAPILIGVLATSFAVAPAFAVSARVERSRHIKVTGKALPTSSDVGNSKDPAIGKTAPTIAGQGLDGSAVTCSSAILVSR